MAIAPKQALHQCFNTLETLATATVEVSPLIGLESLPTAVGKMPIPLGSVGRKPP
jgi:hypothetical protein